MADAFDIVVIGSGPGGYRAAVLAALRGRRVAIVERGDWGGCCLNRGCVPKKDWYDTARLLAAGRRFRERGIAGSLAGDLAGAWRHQEQVVATVQASYLDYLKRLGARAVAGSASLGPGRRVQVTGASGVENLAASAIILATGSRPRLPSGIGLIPDRVITTDELFDRPVPRGDRVAIIGAGAVATELAFILRQFGKEISWLVRGAPLARSRFSNPARAALSQALSQAGIAPRLTAVSGMTVSADGVRLELDRGEERVDWVLVATGRAPVTGGLDLAQAGVNTTDAGFVQIDSHLETTAPGIYAVGDCAGGPLTANQALADAAVVVSNIIDGSRRTRETDWVPEVIYSALELARAGRNEDEAEAAGLEPAVGFSAFETSPAALGQADPAGFVRLIGDLDTGALVGGEVVGQGAGELIHLLSLAPDPATALAWLERGRFNHPARAEEFQNAVETLAMKWGLAGSVFGRK